MRKLIVGGCAVLAVAGCATGSQQPQRATLGVTLNGIQEVPGPGDPDGIGTAEIRVDARQSNLCWRLNVRQVDPATAAHIHRGAAGTAGPPVVTLTTPDANGLSEGCTTIEEPLASELVLRSYGFYVNVHNPAFPAGAVRGQLRGGPIADLRR